MSKKLYYFNVNGLAESIRFILHYSGEKYEDVQYDLKSWPIKSIKDSLPHFGQLPVYEEGSRTLYQSMAIARYVGTKANLLPTDPFEQALLDAVVLTFYDYWEKLRVYINEEDLVKKQALKKKVFEETIDFYFTRFEKELKSKNGFFGGKLTWADFVFAGFIEATNLFLGIEVEKKYPTVQALYQKIRTLPGVKEYIATRKPYFV